MAAPGYFPPALRAFASRNKIAGLRHPPLALRPSASLRVQVRSARRLVIATKAAMGAADPTKGLTMTTDHDDTEFEPPHSSSPTDHVLNELQLYGYRPFHDEPDPRPLPEGDTVAGAVADIFDALVVDFERHPPRTRPRGPALVDGQPVPPRHRPHRTRARRQRAGAAARASASRTARRCVRSNSSVSRPRASR